MYEMTENLYYECPHPRHRVYSTDCDEACIICNIGDATEYIKHHTQLYADLCRLLQDRPHPIEVNQADYQTMETFRKETFKVVYPEDKPCF